MASAVAFPHDNSVVAAWVIFFNHAPLHRQRIALAFQSKMFVVDRGSGTVIVTSHPRLSAAPPGRSIRVRVRVGVRVRVRVN